MKKSIIAKQKPPSFSSFTIQAREIRLCLSQSLSSYGMYMQTQLFSYNMYSRLSPDCLSISEYFRKKGRGRPEQKERRGTRCQDRCQQRGGAHWIIRKRKTLEEKKRGAKPQNCIIDLRHTQSTFQIHVYTKNIIHNIQYKWTRT